MSARTGAERISVLRMGDVLIAAIRQELTARSALELQRDMTEMADKEHGTLVVRPTKEVP